MLECLSAVNSSELAIDSTNQIEKNIEINCNLLKCFYERQLQEKASEFLQNVLKYVNEAEAISEDSQQILVFALVDIDLKKGTYLKQILEINFGKFETIQCSKIAKKIFETNKNIEGVLAFVEALNDNKKGQVILDNLNKIFELAKFAQAKKCDIRLASLQQGTTINKMLNPEDLNKEN